MTILQRIWRLLQWLISVGALLVAAATPLSYEKLTAPGAPVQALWISLGCFALLAITLSPPIFFRVPKSGKIGSFVGFVLAFFVMAYFHGEAMNAYYRTPEGAKVAARKAAEKKAEADQQRTLEIMEAAVAQHNEQVDKLEACLNWQKQVPAFSEAVENSMHNPASFEHVSTKFIEPTSDGSNIVMEVRGTNGFGGVVTSRIFAKIDPDTCQVTDLVDAN